MKTKTLKLKNMLRINEVDLLNKLQEKFELSTSKSANSFFISILKNYAFKDTKRRWNFWQVRNNRRHN